MNIVLIGPVYPFVGGISHYTGLLASALKKSHTVNIISYKMMYPKFLHKKAQKDYSDSSFKIDGVKYLIDTANPFNIISTAKYINKLKPDVVLIQWWHPYFAPCYKILSNHLAKDIRLLFTCHNVFPHERFPLDKQLTRLVLKEGQGFIIHSKRDETDLLSINPNAIHVYNPLPAFNAFKLKNLSISDARKEIVTKDNFNITPNSKILLFFGFVREYKGLKYAIEAMPEILKDLPDTKLLIVGSFGKNKEEYLSLINYLDISSSIFIKDDYTPDNEVEKYFSACDLVILPYIDATQSGIVQIAFSFEKPCVVTNVGGLPDVVDDMSTGFIVPPRDSGAISTSVIKFFGSDMANKMQNNIQTNSYRFSWDKMVKSIESLSEK